MTGRPVVMPDGSIKSIMPDGSIKSITYRDLIGDHLLLPSSASARGTDYSFINQELSSRLLLLERAYELHAAELGNYLGTDVG
jgi:hypothetical protein